MASSWVSVVVLHLALLLVQAGMSGYQIITRVALTGGMSLFTFAVYRGAIGLCFLVPAAFFLERNNRPPLTWTLMGHFFLLGMTGIFLSQAFFLEGLTYTSPTFAAAIQNSIPAITFIIAVVFGQERVHIKRIDGQAKVAGTLLCVIGATLMVFYKGPTLVKLQLYMQLHTITTRFPMPPLSFPSSPIEIHNDTIAHVNVVGIPHLIGTSIVNHARNHSQQQQQRYLVQHELAQSSIPFGLTAIKSWQLGAFCHMGMCIAFSFWLVMQSPVIKQYPARLSVTAFTSFFGTLQLLVLAICKEQDLSKWTLPWGPQLIAVLYAGVVVSCLVFSLQMWCVQKGGAVLTAVYQPAQTIIVAILTFLFLRENFFLGSLVGGLLIIGGLYLVTWGQGKERKIAASFIPTSMPPLMDPSKTNITQIFLDNGKDDQPLTQPLLEDTYQNPPLD